MFTEEQVGFFRSMMREEMISLSQELLDKFERLIQLKLEELELNKPVRTYTLNGRDYLETTVKTMLEQAEKRTNPPQE